MVSLTVNTKCAFSLQTSPISRWRDLPTAFALSQQHSGMHNSLKLSCQVYSHKLIEAVGSCTGQGWCRTIQSSIWHWSQPHDTKLKVAWSSIQTWSPLAVHMSWMTLMQAIRRESSRNTKFCCHCFVVAVVVCLFHNGLWDWDEVEESWWLCFSDS